MSDTPMNATIAARPSSTRAMCVPDEVVSEVVDCGAGDVALATALLVVLVLEVWSLEAEAEAEAGLNDFRENGTLLLTLWF